MSQPSAIVYVFHGRSARVEVRRATSSPGVDVIIRPAEQDKQFHLHFVEWICQGAAEAGEVGAMLRAAAALAAWVEEGGAVEEWLIEATRPPRCESN